MPRKLTLEDFINKANIVHNSKYNYSKTHYISMVEKVIIICPIHGEFSQAPKDHINKKLGCPKCGKKIQSNKESFIDKATTIHNNKYQYTHTTYTDAHTKVIITCPIHGDFQQTPTAHLKGQGCPKCSKYSVRYTTSSFIEASNLVHSNKYDYSKAIYVNSRVKINIICPIHGTFSQLPMVHLRGHGCPYCKESNGEKIIKQYLKSQDINYISEYRNHNCKDKYILPFDFYLPDSNICIEFDGIQHYQPINGFGGIDRFKTLQYHDQLKTQYCKDNDIKLIRIPYTEIDNINQILKENL